MENLKEFNIPVNGITIHGVKIGEGEPFLLLHGHPESCRMWHKLIPELSRHFTVVAADLRGYGDSGRPEDVPDHSNYSKRVMAEDMIALMQSFGFSSFHVMGHDRGGARRLPDGFGSPGSHRKDGTSRYCIHIRYV